MKIQNNKTKTHLVLGLSLVTMLLSSSSLGTIFVQATNNSSVFSPIKDNIPTWIMQQASQMPPHSKDVTFLNIEERVHGFSGLYIDDNRILNVYTTDPTIKSIDKSTLTDYLEPYQLANGIIVKHSKHSWHKWMELEDIIKQLADNNALGINLRGVDDKNQVYVIGFEKLDSSKIDTVNKFLADHNIPANMVELKEVGKIVDINDDTMPCNSNQEHDYSPITIKSILAGAEIGIPGAESGWCSYTPKCTLGFIVKQSGSTYDLTAGHCQAYPANWDNGQQLYTQPYSTTSQNSNHNYPLGRSIGYEIAGSMKTAHSDTLLFNPGTETSGFGQIYQYGYSTVSITGKAYSQAQGDEVCSSGAGSQTTRCGFVQMTGLTVNGHADTNSASYGSVGGDSGSPVWNPNGGITVYGTAFAAGGTTTTYYSTVSGIETDHGVLQFH